MSQNLPFESIFKQINDLLQVLADNADRPLKNEIPPEIETRLSQLEKEMEAFQQLGKATVAKLGVSNEEMEEYLKKGGLAISEQQRRIFERTDQLKRDIEMKKEFLMRLPENKGIKESQRSEIFMTIPEIQSKGSRKNRFKRLGGNANWRPL